MVRLVDDDEIPLGRNALLEQVFVFGDAIDAGDDALIGLERPKLGHVRFSVLDAIIVEQHQKLMGLTEDLAEPLDGERLWREDQNAAGAALVAQTSVDQRRLDGLTEANFIGEQHAYRVALDSARRDVDLVRQPLSARPENCGAAWALAQLGEIEALYARADNLGVSERECAQALDRTDIADFGHELRFDDLLAVFELVDCEALALGFEALTHAMLFATAIAYTLAARDLIADDDRLGASRRVRAIFLQTPKFDADHRRFDAADHTDP